MKQFETVWERVTGLLSLLILVVNVMSAREKLSTQSDGRVSVDESPVENELSTDDVFHLLQSQRRRAAIRYL
ncbi:hypothetical protein BG842_01570 [Haladaptatus sp. W1]|nr:hypothetical protein BG842_01570 [Haladaptatus sp. W1]